MRAAYYRDVIERSVADGNGEVLDSVAARLADSADALRILRALGYTGSSLTMIARQVAPAGPKNDI